MKTNIILIVLIALYSCKGKLQKHSSSVGSKETISEKTHEKDLIKYFLIKGEQNEYEGEIYKNIYPDIVKDTIDSLAIFINKNKRRFSYVLNNKTNDIYQDSSFQNLFPDTIKMTEVYRQQLKKNTKALSYLKSFAYPPESSDDKLNFSKSELMDVASKFFLCDRVNPDTTINWHVCIGLNGMKEAEWAKDYTLLEAFSFEAIFYGLRSEDEKETQFMHNFLAYVSDAQKEFKDLPFDAILEKTKKDVFKKMEGDKDLITLLMNYYTKKKDELPFEIV